MNLKTILKGCRIDYNGVQSIMGLTILPLTCDKQLSFDDKYASPYDHKASTSTYGDVTLHKSSGVQKDVLVYPNSSYITAGLSQDHLISKAALLKKMSINLKDSRCIQSDQGGTFTAQAAQRTVIAPMKLREVAYNYVGQGGYNLLWPAITEFNREHASPSSPGKAILKDYFNKWDKELDTFIAHFERIDKCIGFITLYNDEVVAIDKFPSFTYTSQIWNQLVRDSYAALVIEARVRKNIPKGSMKTVADIKGDNLEDVYNSLVGQRSNHYKQLLEEVIDIEFDTKTDKDTPGSVILEHEGYVGQVIDDNGINVLVSIIKKAKFDPEKMRKAHKMKKVAKDQRDFSL